PPFFPVRRLTLFIAIRNFFWIGIFSLSSASLTFTTRPRDFVSGLSAAGVPYRLVFAISLGFRYIPLIQSEAIAVAAAQKIRGCSRSNLKGIKDALNFMKERVKAVLVSMFRHALHMSISMEKRAFTLYNKRTTVSALSFRKRDYLFIGVVLIGEILLAVYIAGLLPGLAPISLYQTFFVS
nr:energy-coupling factor transporter transmembrane component T [Candidatus Sigynarchaeota archaeon]